MLWPLIKSLGKLAPIYKDRISEDLKAKPADFVLLQESTYDESFVNADGNADVRRCTWDIRIYTTTAGKAADLQKAYVDVFYKNGLSFQIVGPLFFPNEKSYVTDFTGSYIYGYKIT